MLLLTIHSAETSTIKEDSYSPGSGGKAASLRETKLAHDPLLRDTAQMCWSRNSVSQHRRRDNSHVKIIPQAIVSGLEAMKNDTRSRSFKIGSENDESGGVSHDHLAWIRPTIQP